MSMDQVKQIFIAEAQEQLDVMEQYLLEVEAGEATVSEHIDAVFRSAHTIKGSAGLFGYDNVVAFAHTIESVLDEVRSGTLEFDSSLAETLLDSHHYLQSLIESLSYSDVSEADLDSQNDLGKQLEQQLSSYLHKGSLVLDGQNIQKIVLSEDAALETQPWLINVVYSEDVYRDGMDPLSQINFLNTFGDVKRVEVHTCFPESADEYQPESCYLNLSMEFVTSATKEEIEDVFEFIMDTSHISVVKKGEQSQLESVSSAEELRFSTQVPAPVIVGDSEQKKLLEKQFLKIDASKLDRLINLIGELTTASATNELIAESTKNETLIESLNQTAQLVEKIRDDALGLRLVKMKDTFNRLKRIVRDIAKEQNKEVLLKLSGVDAELDKTIVDRLIDPLMHLVRNAIDHGIESQEQRLNQGKNERGTIGIRAYHEAGTFIIEIEDDGAGINQERIVAKAIDASLIDADQPLSVEDINQLIFAPGLSTAETVTTISGRGVGMDVVKRDIENLRGQVKVISEAGKGTHFKIRLPLTLAIIDGFEVMVGDTHLVIPSNLIRGCLPFDTQLMCAEHDILNLRGEMVPFVRMNEVLNTPANISARKHMVMVQFGSQKAGLLVEDILGEVQAVVKPLNAIFRSLKGVGGSTILRTGDIGFILDIPQLIQLAAQRESAFLKSHAKSQLMKVEHV